MAEPQQPHHDPSSPKEGPPQAEPRRRRTAENLPPPLVLILLLLFLLFLLFTGRQKDDSDSDKLVIKPLRPSVITTTVTVHETLSPSSKPTQAPSPPEKVSTMAATEQTFIAIKPDGVQRGLVGPIISRFENRGFKLVAIKLVTPGQAHLEKHYEDLKEKPFFPGLIKYMNSGPICAMVWEGRDAVKTGRTILGATNPLASAPGTIRGDYAIDVGRNVCHGSDSVESAKKEIALWFSEGDVVSWTKAEFGWIYEKP